MKIKKGTKFKHFGVTMTVMAVVGRWAMVQSRVASPPFVVTLVTISKNIEK